MQVDKLEVEFNLISNIQRIYFSLVAFFSNCHFSSFDYRVRSSESLECLVVFDCIYHFSTLDYRVRSSESLKWFSSVWSIISFSTLDYMVRSTESLESLVVFGHSLYHLQP